jgi:hypothetical protein
MKTSVKLLTIVFVITVALCILAACTPGDTTKETTSTVSVTIEANTTTTTNSLYLRTQAEAIPADAIKRNPIDDVYPPVLHSDEYETPVPLAFPVNTAGAEDSPFILPDGNTLYFFFTPDVRIPAEKQLIDGVTGIYKSVKAPDGSWSQPERVILNDDIALDGAEFVLGNTMWFCSARPGYSTINWFTARMIDGHWQNWQYAGGQFPEAYEVGELHFSTDWQELYFHSGRPGGKGGYDVWVTRYVDGVWQQPENIDVVNSVETDGWPYLTQDGNELWFLRYYRGTPAIFRSVKINGEWGEPELIISQFAGEPSLDNDGNIYFVHHFYKDGVMLESDIYIAKKK